jgi:hypothetical protein
MLVAFLLAPIPAVAFMSIIGAASVGFGAVDVLGAGVSLALFGLPIAYAVELLVVLPLYLRYRDAGAVRWWIIVGIATVTGAIVAPLVWWAFWGGPPVWGMVPTGAVLGAVAGGIFWLLAGSILSVSRDPADR